MRLNDCTTRCCRIAHRRNPTSTANVPARCELFTFYVIRQRRRQRRLQLHAATTGEVTRCWGGDADAEVETDTKPEKPIPSDLGLRVQCRIISWPAELAASLVLSFLGCSPTSTADHSHLVSAPVLSTQQPTYLHNLTFHQQSSRVLIVNSTVALVLSISTVVSRVV